MDFSILGDVYVHMELDFVFKLGSKVLDYQSDFTFGENLQVFNLKIWFWPTPLILLWKEIGQHSFDSEPRKKDSHILIKGVNR
jgi:hypothetical protein